MIFFKRILIKLKEKNGENQPHERIKHWFT